MRNEIMRDFGFFRSRSVIASLLELVQDPTGEGSFTNGRVRITQDVAGEACNRHTVCQKAPIGALFDHV